MKKQITTLLLLWLITLSIRIQAQNITKLEYFVDADPGYGAGVDVPITAATSISNNFTVTMGSGLPDGFHKISIRAKDANNQWSMVSSNPFYKQTVTGGGGGGPLPNITAAEYFIDNDPGFGLGTAVAITDNTNISTSFTVAMTNAIPDGFHKISIRAKDANNLWSMVSSNPFYKQTVTGGGGGGPLPNITAAEYFIDADPGFGLGTAVAITANTNVSTSFTVAMTNAIPDGFHKISIRVKDANNNWSMISSNPFYKQTVTGGGGGGPLPNITAAEYFIDADPGFGLGTAVTITPGTTATSSFTVPLPNTVPDGFHKISFRTKDANNDWSKVSTNPFYKETLSENPNLPLANITKMEYFIDADPGYGAGVDVPILVFSKKLPSFLASLTGVTTGAHKITIRAKDANNKWSIVSIKDFVVSGNYVIIKASPESWCVATNFSLPFSTTGTFNAGNIFTAQLSNSAGSFASPVSIGTVTSTTSGTIIANIPNYIGVNTGYRIRIISSNPASTADNSVPISVTSTCQPQIIAGNVPISADVYICTAQTITVPITTYGTFTAGNVFSLQLSDENGNNFATIPSTFSSNTFTADVPIGINTGDSYRIRVVSTSPVVTGKEATQSLKILKDIIPPTITVPGNINTVTNTACTATGVTLGTPTTADNCQVKTVTNNAPTAYPLGTTTVVWTVTDKTGNSTTATQTVTVTDNVLPAITAPAAVSAFTNTGCTATGVSLGIPTTSDNCSVANTANNAPSAFSLGSTTVIWTVTDGAGNTKTATQTVIVTDNVLPTITAPANINLTVATCTAPAVTLGTPTTIDNCSVTSVINNAPGAFPLGTTIVIWTVTDGSGNTKTASQSVTIIENTPPTITAPANVSVFTNTSCTATGVALGTPITADNCSVASIVNNAPAVFPIGSTTVIWTVTDGSGNTKTATQTVTVTDNILPTITAPSAISTFTNTDCTATGVTLGAPTTGDNCTVASTTNNAPTIYPLGATTVIWTVTDGSGNTKTATQVVTVTDNVLPTITAPAAINTAPNSGCNATGVVLGMATTADNCTVASVTNNAPTTFPSGATNVIWTVTDGSGNTKTAVQVVTVTDNILPNITAPANVSAFTNTACTATGVALGTPTSSDNCGAPIITNNAPTAFPLGITTVIWTATDVAGNTKTATQSVTITDNVLPIITPPAAISRFTNTGCTATGVTLGTPITADNCTVASTTNNAPTIFPLGATTVIWTVTDGSGNTKTATQVVTVVDNVQPTITAPAAVNIPPNSGCNATGVMLGTPTTADNCSVASVTNNAPTTFPSGATNVIWTVTDGSGNTKTAVQVVTVTDNILPNITAPANLSTLTNTACTATSVVLGTPTSSDNCGAPTVTNNAPTAFPLGTTTVIWTATDAAGNTKTATQTVTVTDNVLPTITAPVAISRFTNTGCTATGVTVGTPTIADNCTVASVTNNAPTVFPLGATTVIWTVTDGSGNTKTATQVVTVTDNILPTITAPAALTIISTVPVTNPNIGNATTADNCSVASVTNNKPTTFPLGNTTVIWTVTDGSGNTKTATQVVTVTSCTTMATTKSGAWNDPTVWTCGRIPVATDPVRINTGHVINVPTGTFPVKNITYAGGTIELGSGGNIQLNP